MSDLDQLAAAAGLQPDWQDYRGAHHRVAPETLMQALHSLGLPASTPAELRASREALSADAELAPALTTVDAGSIIEVPRRFAQAAALEWQAEAGADAASSIAMRESGRFAVPSQPGYYRLTDGQQQLRYAVAPASALPVALQGQRRWGLSAQIYSLPRSGDGGTGDFAGLGALAQWAARQGADALAMSPAHALFTADPGRFSPYAPSSRLFLNVLYGDTGLPGAESVAGEALIDWPRASAQRLALLRQAHARCIATGHEADALRQFVREGGAALLAHARFEALSAHFCAQGLPCAWPAWPAAFHDPQSPAVAEFAAAHAAEVDFHLFAQWLAATSLRAAQQKARDAGMAIGLIGDLAVGTDAGGSHAWSLQQGLLQGLSVGAPPDLMASDGQNWGLTTFSPRALQQSGFMPFIDLLRANLRGIGGLRIDHILGLSRLWVAPAGGPASAGVYLRYPLVDLLRLIRLEAFRQQALIIGEDLGTVPAGLRQQLSSSGVLGMQVLWFERDHGFFIEPQRWSTQAMATTTTHDVPTLAGWWQGGDLAWRAAAGQATSADIAGQQALREEDRGLLWGALRHQGLVDGSPPPAAEPAAVVDAAIDFVAGTPAPLAMVPIEDLLGVAEQTNVPGTTDEHPNWRRRLPVAVEALDGDAAALRRAALIARRRPRA